MAESDQPKPERFTVRPREEYTSADLEHLSDLEHVRKRPSMYLGGVGEGGLQAMSDEVLDEAMSEVLSGLAERVQVTINSDGSLTVEDDGRGVPVDSIDGELGNRVTFLECVMTSLSYRPEARLREQRYARSSAHAVGIPIVNFLSREFVVENRWDGRQYRQHYFRGTPKGPVEDVGPASGSGVRITFLPDEEIFGAARINSGRLITRLEELSFLFRGTRIEFEDRRKLEFFSRNGLAGYVAQLNKPGAVLHDVVYAKGERDGVSYDAAFQYRGEPWRQDSRAHVYVNSHPVTEGGTPWDGFLRAVSDTLLEFGAARCADVHAQTPMEAFTKGLTSVVSVRLKEPRFFGSTKTKLGNLEAGSAIYQGLTNHLRSYWEQHPEVATVILDHIQRT